MQVFVTNTSKKPKDIYSFLAPTIRNLLTLEDVGMNIRGIDDNNIKAKAYVGAVIGDIPAISELIFHSGHTSYKACRLCKVAGLKKETTEIVGTASRISKSGGIYFPKEKSTELEPEKRTKQEFEVTYFYI